MGGGAVFKTKGEGPVNGEAGGRRLCFLNRTEFVLLTVYTLGPICC